MNNNQNITPDVQAADDQDTEGHDIALGSSFLWASDARDAPGARKDTAGHRETTGQSIAPGQPGDGPSDAHDVRLTRHDGDDVEGHAVFRSGTGTTNARLACLARRDAPGAGDARTGRGFA